MGYDYIAFDDHHFNEDLQYKDAVPMFHRLEKRATDRGLEFGLKLSNTFPVDVKAGELPSEEMYMAGKSLFPLTTTMAARLSREFDGKLRLSYAGGADAFNIDKLFACGIWPITMATTELKPGGYQRFTQIGEILDKLDFAPFGGVDVLGIDALALSARRDKYHLKDIKPLPRRKMLEKVPLMDCFTAPCEGGCPIRQDIPEYIELCRKEKYTEALALITEKNALPFTTGTICAHRCQTKCTRNYYDDPVQIRATKLIAAEKGYEGLMASLKKPEPVTDGRKAAIIGGGPTGIAAAYFLGRAGIPVTIFEKSHKLGGVPRLVIPGFRISEEAMEKDIALMQFFGAEVKLNTPAPSVSELKAMGYTHIFFAVGERVDSDLFTANGIEVNAKGIPEFRTNLENVFVGGDAMRGPATVVEGIADAQYFANAVIGSVHSVAIPDDAHATRDEAIARKGVLCPPKAGCEGERCLHCNTVCQVCADVCPNRANVVITLPDGRHEILHVDRMCNECGNCAVFCPYDSAPYRNKFTLFLTREGFDESTENQGFLPLEGRKVLVRLDGKVFEADLDGQNQLPADVETFILTVLKDYAYLL